MKRQEEEKYAWFPAIQVGNGELTLDTYLFFKNETPLKKCLRLGKIELATSERGWKLSISEFPHCIEFL